MKSKADPIKIGDMSDELRDYKIMQVEQHSEEMYAQILEKISEIKDYIFNSQDTQLRQLEQRVEALERQNIEEKKKIKEKTKEKQQIKITTLGSIITQAISIITSVLTVTILLYFGLR